VGVPVQVPLFAVNFFPTVAVPVIVGLTVETALTGTGVHFAYKVMLPVTVISAEPVAA
jgi:hypothetical protein